MAQVTLGGQTYTLRAPPSPAYRIDIIVAGERASSAGKAAALAACLPMVARPRARLEQHAHEIMPWGRAVCDEMLARGWSYPEIMRAGVAALELCAEGLDRYLEAEEEAKEAEGNSGAPAVATGAS